MWPRLEKFKISPNKVGSMGVCELCGKESRMITAIIEGTRLNVCSGCAKMGKIVHKPVVRERIAREAKPEVVEILVSDFGKRIREAREKSGLTQKEFAQKLNEKESIMHKIESGGFRPTIEKAKRFERALKIKLVEVSEETPAEITKGKSSALTIGDIIEIK